MRNLLNFADTTNNCSERTKEHSFVTVRYYLRTRQAEMKCLNCSKKYFRTMNDIERMMYLYEEKSIIDVRRV